MKETNITKQKQTHRFKEQAVARGEGGRRMNETGEEE